MAERSGSSNGPIGDDEIRVTKVTPGYGHTRYEGLCGPSVTVHDIKNRFYHPMFGGRDASVQNGRFKAVCHND